MKEKPEDNKEKITEKSKEDIKFCLNCGKDIDSDRVYCKHCDFKIS